MAEHVLETILQLRYDNYGAWMNSDLILKAGEAAIAVFPYQRTITGTDSRPDNTPPSIGIKIGDGVHPFRYLPWVQAIAADVYSWAKESDKPVYTAAEIEGLASYIEQYAAGAGGGGAGAARIYQIIRGTSTNANKYYLQYKESDSNTWITDTEHYIDVDSFVKVANWIGDDINYYDSIGDRTEEHIQYDLSRLKFTDSEQNGYFVTSVSQTNGKINVLKKLLNSTDINGIIPVSKGGTGRTTLESGYALVGNGENAVSLLPIDYEVENTNNLVTSRAIRTYVDQATAGIKGAMHFIGDATVAPTGANNPQVSGYNFSKAQMGDVVLWESKEYVWAGTWRLLGDEGSYAIKGSIKDIDIHPEANIQQSKIAGLSDALSLKVDKETGKGLSTNDYTTEDKLKLAGIADGAQVNTIESISLNGNPCIIKNKNVDLEVREYPLVDQQKLAGIANGAQVNVIEHIFYNNTEVIPDQNKNIRLNETIQVIQVDGNQLIPDANHMVSFTTTHTEYENKIEHITYDGTEVNIDNNKTAAIQSNPHTEHENKIEHIVYNGTELSISNDKTVTITPDQHTEHENKIEAIYLNDVLQEPNIQKQVRLIINEQTLGLQSIMGAVIPNGINGYEDVPITINNKLQLARIAANGNVSELLQTQNTYILIDCGTSTDVID